MFTDAYAANTHNKRTLWTDGHTVMIDAPKHIANLQRRGYHMHIIGTPDTDNQLRFTIPAPTLAANQRLYLNQIILRFKTQDNDIHITGLHIDDHQKNVFSKTNLDLHGNLMDRAITLPTPRVSGKIDLSLDITFGKAYQRQVIELLAIGCEYLLL